MSRWRKVDAGLWSDDRFAALSDDARLLWLRFLTGPEVTCLPGLLVAGRAGLAEAMRWEMRRFLSAFAELAHDPGDGRAPLAVADWETRVVWLPNGHRHNPPHNPSVVQGWALPWRVVPECGLKRMAYAALASLVGSLGEGYAQQFSLTIPSPKHRPHDDAPHHLDHDGAHHSSPAPAPALSGEITDQNARPRPTGSGPPIGPRELEYRAAYERGVERGSGAPSVFDWRPWDQGVLNAVLPKFAKYTSGEKIGGAELIQWIELAACDFARDVTKTGRMQFYGGFSPKGFARWIAEDEARKRQNAEARACP